MRLGLVPINLLAFLPYVTASATKNLLNNTFSPIYLSTQLLTQASPYNVALYLRTTSLVVFGTHCNVKTWCRLICMYDENNGLLSSLLVSPLYQDALSPRDVLCYTRHAYDLHRIVSNVYLTGLYYSAGRDPTAIVDGIYPKSGNDYSISVIGGNKTFTVDLGAPRYVSTVICLGYSVVHCEAPMYTSSEDLLDAVNGNFSGYVYQGDFLYDGRQRYINIGDFVRYFGFEMTEPGNWRMSHVVFL